MDGPSSVHGDNVVAAADGEGDGPVREDEHVVESEFPGVKDEIRKVKAAIRPNHRLAAGEVERPVATAIGVTQCFEGRPK